MIADTFQHAADNNSDDRLVTTRCAFTCGEHKRAFQLTRAEPFPTDCQRSQQRVCRLPESGVGIAVHTVQQRLVAKTSHQSVLDNLF